MRKLIYIIVILMSIWGSASAQMIESDDSAGDNSTNNSTRYQRRENDTIANITEINAGNITLLLPDASAISLEFFEKGWTYAIINSKNTIGNDFINLAFLEETSTGVLFYFYRLSEGTDVLNFKRLDGNTVYSIILELQWDKNVILKDNKSIYQDEYMMIKSINNSFVAPEDMSEDMSEDTPEEQSSQNDMDMLSTDTSMSTKETMPKKTQEKINNRVDDIRENNRSDLINEDAIISFSELNAIQNRDDENTEYFEYKEAVLSVFEELSYEEMKKFIDDNWTSIPYDTMMSNISLWINSHPDMFQQASLLWTYAKHIESKITKAEDLHHITALCRRIIDMYPLSYEYEKAQELMYELEYRYKYLKSFQSNTQ